MSVKIRVIKSFLLFTCTLLLAFAFPFQVASSSALPSLIPYIILIIIFALTKLQKPYSLQLRWNARKPIIFMINVYLALLVFHTGWQTILGFITLDNGISAIVNFFLPVLFFVYFRNIATNEELRILFLAISLVGLIIGLYFVYDSYSMLVLGKLNDYSIQAFEYSQLRSPDLEVSESRVSVGYRSHGLLENHAVSAAWIVIGCFSTLTLLLDGQRVKRGFVIALTGVILLISLNFTAIVGFVFLMFMFEGRGYKLLQGVIPMRLAKLLTQVLISVIVISLASFKLIDAEYTDMVGVIYNSLSGQMSVATGSTEIQGSTYFIRLLSAFISYPNDIFEYPPGLLIGDGFSAFGMTKGGDYGIVETLHRFGIPFFVAIILGLIGLVCRILKKAENVVPEQSVVMSYLWFGAGVVTYLMFTEIHYSVWSSKSILPILFICLAIFDKYLYRPNPRSPECQGLLQLFDPKKTNICAE
jgi:hypothetical protein